MPLKKKQPWVFFSNAGTPLGRKAHIFKCSASHCCGKTRFVRQFLDKGDTKSTSNLRYYAKTCWGEEAVAAADGTQDVKSAHDALANHKDGTITVAFQCAGKGKVMYSHCQHTKVESWYVWFIFCSYFSHLRKPSARSSFVGLLRANIPFKLSTTTLFVHSWKLEGLSTPYPPRRPCRIDEFANFT